jgi:type I restriction enzyme S subunit
VIELPDQRMWFSSAELKTLTLRRGDVVVVEGGAGYGRSAVLDKDLDGWGFQNSIVRVRPKSGLADARFIDYAIQAALLSGEIESFVSTATIPHFTAEKVARLPIVDIHAANQRAISDFLDRETAQIDAFIAKNEELIALLTERRTATITRCVTSGLSGSAGLQEGHWTASVPGHWQVMPLRYAIGKIDQGVSPQAEAGLAVDAGQVGVLKSGCANGGVFLPLEHKVLPSDFVFDPAIQINVGDLLVNRASGSVSLLGSAAIVTENPYQLILSDKTFRIWPSGRTSRHYLYWLLNSRLYREQVEATVSGAEGLANNLPMSRLRSFSLPFPPLAEQRKLIVFLERETSAISQAILIASRGIDLARERRAALISAAVTGKIDVGVSA